MRPITEALRPIRTEDFHVVLDAVMSIYLNMAVKGLGIARTDDALRLQRKNLPRVVAAIRAHKAPPAGSA